MSSSTFGNLSCDVKSDPSTNVCSKWAGKLSDEVPNNDMSRKVIGMIPCRPANQIKVTENIIGEVFASVFKGRFFSEGDGKNFQFFQLPFM